MENMFNMVFALMGMAGIGCLVCNYFYEKHSDPESSLDAKFKPMNLLDMPNGEKDDLKRIKGVGPKLEARLNSLGVFHFSQIAQWSEQELEWIDDYLAFKGRAKRDDWIAQARDLS